MRKGSIGVSCRMWESVLGKVYSADTTAEKESGRAGAGRPTLTEETVRVISRAKLLRKSYLT
jgi:hypothetical protein